MWVITLHQYITVMKDKMSLVIFKLSNFLLIFGNFNFKSLVINFNPFWLQNNEF